MLNFIFLAILQAATEFLPVSSSGHLALFSYFTGGVDLFLVTWLHLASLFAVIVFTRKEILKLVSFKKPYRKLWVFLMIATIPAALIGFYFGKNISASFSSPAFIGISYFFTALILFLTKFSKETSNISLKNSVIIGLFQSLALFPGISRSGITVSSALFCGVKKEEAVKFSFLLFIPLSLGAFFIGSKKTFYLNMESSVSFIVCFFASLFFLKLFFKITKKGKIWLFSIYCALMGLLSLILAV